jgi:hypothetical protein
MGFFSFILFLISFINFPFAVEMSRSIQNFSTITFFFVRKTQCFLILKKPVFDWCSTVFCNDGKLVIWVLSKWEILYHFILVFTVGILEFTIFVYKLLEFTIDSSYNSSSFQKKIVISVAASPLNKGWFKIQQKTRAPYSLQLLGLPHVQSSSFQILEFTILEFRDRKL